MRDRMFRFSKYMEVKGLNDNKVTVECELSQGLLGQARKDKSDLGLKTIEKILERYQDLNRTWLLTGEGDMLINEEQPAAPTQDTKPHLPIAVIAGRMGGISEAVRLHECEQLPVVYAFPNYDYTMMVQGDSMEPKYEGGDRIAIRKVCDYVEWGKTYVVDTADGALLKRIYDEGDTIRCVSFNKDYPDFHVNKQNIYGLYKVVGLLRVNQ